MGFSFDSAISFFCYYLPCARSTSPGQSYTIHVKHVMCRNIIYRRFPFNQTFRNLPKDGNFIENFRNANHSTELQMEQTSRKEMFVHLALAPEVVLFFRY